MSLESCSFFTDAGKGHVDPKKGNTVFPQGYYCKQCSYPPTVSSKTQTAPRSIIARFISFSIAGDVIRWKKSVLSLVRQVI
jgi:hypothetical protein